MRVFILCFLALVMVGSAGPAAAGVLTVDLYDGTKTIGMQYNGYNRYGVYGTYTINGLDADAFAVTYDHAYLGMGYCVDLNGDIPGFPYSYNVTEHDGDFSTWPQFSPPPQTILLRSHPNQVAYIVNHYGRTYSGTDEQSEDRRGAVAAAIWKAAYGDDFTVTNWGDVDQATYNMILNDSAGKSESTTWFEWNGGYGMGGQDVMIPVPEPGTLILLGTGLVAAGIARRKRRN